MRIENWCASVRMSMELENVVDWDVGMCLDNQVLFYGVVLRGSANVIVCSALHEGFTQLQPCD